MTSRHSEALQLGPVLIQRLIPVRPPYLMVDRVEAYSSAPAPTLFAVRHVSANEPIAAAHFVGRPIWPGALLMEGLSQAAGLLTAVVMIRRESESRGQDPSTALDALRRMEQSLRPESMTRADAGAPGDEIELALASRYVQMLAASQMKFRKPVVPGERVDYTVRLVRELEGLWNFAVDASVAGQCVADGSLTNALILLGRSQS